MKIERLPQERWGELREFFAEFGEAEMPHGEIRAAIEGGEILGWYLIERSNVHLGPFYVRGDFRGNGVASAMAEDAMRILPDEDVYVAALNPQTEQMCEKFGMTKIEGTLYQRRK